MAEALHIEPGSWRPDTPCEQIAGVTLPWPDAGLTTSRLRHRAIPRPPKTNNHALVRAARRGNHRRRRGFLHVAPYQYAP